VSRSARARSRGASAAECMVALGVLTIVVSAAMDGVAARGQGALLSKDAMRVRLAAASRLESAPTRPLAPGRLAFDAQSPGLSAEEEVREVAPGLLEVDVRVRAASGASTRMTTRVAVEGRKP
jgi:hypothetical protein